MVVHPSPPRKPPGFTLEGHLAKMLTTAQPDLPGHVAESIACSATLPLQNPHSPMFSKAPRTRA